MEVVLSKDDFLAVLLRHESHAEAFVADALKCSKRATHATGKGPGGKADPDKKLLAQTRRLRLMVWTALKDQDAELRVNDKVSREFLDKKFLTVWAWLRKRLPGLMKGLRLTPTELQATVRAGGKEVQRMSSVELSLMRWCAAFGVVGGRFANGPASEPHVELTSPGFSHRASASASASASVSTSASASVSPSSSEDAPSSSSRGVRSGRASKRSRDRDDQDERPAFTAPAERLSNADRAELEAAALDFEAEADAEASRRVPRPGASSSGRSGAPPELQQSVMSKEMLGTPAKVLSQLYTFAEASDAPPGSQEDAKTLVLALIRDSSSDTANKAGWEVVTVPPPELMTFTLSRAPASPARARDVVQRVVKLLQTFLPGIFAANWAQAALAASLAVPSGPPAV